MINKRFRYNRKLIENELNRLKLMTKQSVRDKIERKKYVFERIKCLICGKNNFEPLSEIDRDNLYMPVVICKNCGLIQTNPRMTQESYRQFYNSEYRIIKSGEKNPSEEFFKNQMLVGKKIYDYLVYHLGRSLKEEFIVEVGTGAGGILQYFKDKGNKVFGLDLGKYYIEFGKQKGLNLIEGDIDKLKQLKRKSDVIIYCHVLEHVLNPIKEMNQLKKYLKKDGIVYIEVPGIKYLEKSYQKDFLNYLDFAHTYHFSLSTLRIVMAKAGFRMIEGDEQIRAIFKSEKNNNDYKEIVKFLKEVERKRLMFFNLGKLDWEFRKFFIAFFKKTKTDRIVKKVYHLVKYFHLSKGL